MDHDRYHCAISRATAVPRCREPHGLGPESIAAKGPSLRNALEDALADFLTPAERSIRMSRIRSRDTKPELRLRKAVHALGLRYRLHGPLPGKPDLVFPRYRAVVFVHGCFWHRHHGCKVASTPKSNTTFWVEKFERNTTRDAEVQRRLETAGWLVLTVWECDLGTPAKAEAAARRLAAELDPTRALQKVRALAR